MINEELYGLLKSINKKYKYIGYDRGSFDAHSLFNEMTLILIDKKPTTKHGYFQDLWKYDTQCFPLYLFPCLSQLINGETKIYSIDILLDEYEQMLIDEEAVECLRELGGEE